MLFCFRPYSLGSDAATAVDVAILLSIGLSPKILLAAMAVETVWVPSQIASLDKSAFRQRFQAARALGSTNVASRTHGLVLLNRKRAVHERSKALAARHAVRVIRLCKNKLRTHVDSKKKNNHTLS